MNISSAFPPNYRAIEDTLGALRDYRPLFCYGKTIYNPYKRDILPDDEAHEAVHAEQQYRNGLNPEMWWYKYLNGRQFRLEQEIEAYSAQYEFAKEHGVAGKLLDWLKERLANELSGEAYGTLISYGEAVSKIRNYKRVSSAG